MGDSANTRIKIENANDIWKYVEIGHGYNHEPGQLMIETGDDGSVYISIEGNCEWEIEHGVQLVVKNGLKVTKLGPYDGEIENPTYFPKGVRYINSEMQDEYFKANPPPAPRERKGCGCLTALIGPIIILSSLLLI
ncbi:MAG: hypothetical protein HRU15_19440 [Planctomycetes bacterium]|nr:hypothetical protein [Planctomycetota bacterium]